MPALLAPTPKLHRGATRRLVRRPEPAPPPGRVRSLRPLGAAAVAGGAAALAALALPRGPVTAGQALALVAVALVAGAATGLLLRSRFALVVAPIFFVAAFELRWLGLESPVLDPPRLDSDYGLLAALLGRGFLVFVMVLPLLLGAALGAALARPRPEPRRPAGKAWLLLRRLVLGVTAVGVVALAVLIARPATTPPILGPDGEPLPGSVAALEQIELGGVPQWISVRGASAENPVIVYLSGGPGQTDMPQVRAWWHELERDFTIVNLDERGVGKSYPALDPTAEITLDRAVADAIELAERMRDRFGEEKVYLVGESWGSLVGVLAVERRPDLFHAYVGSGQMVDIAETDRLLYEDMLAYAERTGDEAAAETMRGFGPPPYEDVFANAYVMGYYERLAGAYDLPAYVEDRAAEVRIGPWGVLGEEYTLVEKVNVLRSLVDYFAVMYPQAQAIDLRQDVTRLEVPVYLVQGRHELDARTALVPEWLDRLEAPSEQLVWFEQAGHATAFEEYRRFHELMTETVLAETYRR